MEKGAAVKNPLRTFVMVIARDPGQFEEEINKALANGFEPYGEFHYVTWCDDSEGRIEQWSMAMLKDETK
jgi:hypothetical protein